MKRIPGIILYHALYLLCIFIFFAVPVYVWELVTGKPLIIGALLGIACAGIAVFLVSRYALFLQKQLAGFSETISKASRNRWLFLIILTGIALRIAWVVNFPAPQVSDQATYVSLAKNLVENGRYYTAGTYAFWPPGYPLLLSLIFLFVGPEPWVPAALNIILFVLSIIVVYRLALLIANEAAARLATLLLALWPNYVMLAGIASKEEVLATLLPLVLLLYVNSVKEPALKKKLFFFLIAGFIIGFASLIQPSTLLFLGVILICEFIFQEKAKNSILKMSFLTLSICLIIMPWTIRNYSIFHKWVLVSTSGGGNLYIANNPWATGGHIEKVPYNLGALDEIQSNSVGYKLGREWIMSHPLDFLRLAIRKQILLWGDDSFGPYETLKRSALAPGRTYVLCKGICLVYWLGAWLMIFLSLSTSSNKQILYRTPYIAVLILPIMYVLAIHSVFESSSKHHMSLIGAIAILASLCIVSANQKNTSSAVGQNDRV